MNEIDVKRIIHVQGGYNFRDLGGLPTITGKSVQKGKLFRADELSNLEPKDLDILDGLNVHTVVDFRTQEERSKSIDRLPNSCKREFQLDILSASIDSYVQEIKSGRTDFKQFLIDFYKDLVLGDNAVEQWRKFFEIIETPDNIGTVYHCSAGKDRTGIATAFILEALGVDRQIIMSDYMLSNYFLKLKYASYINENPHYADLFLVQPDYLNSSYEAIESKYSTVENYLTSVLHVDLEQMRKLYVI